MNTTDLDITSLRNCAVDAKPIDFTFDVKTNEDCVEDAGTWRISERIQSESGEQDCSDCDGDGVYIDEFDVTTDCELCDGEGTDDLDGGDHEAWWPKMNIAMTIPELEVPDNWRDCLCNMTVVEIGEDTFLALTGGGMDMSWAICETYIRLGYLPPAHYSELPAMAGRGESAGDKAIIAACIRSLRMLSDWNDRKAARMVELYGLWVE